MQFVRRGLLAFGGIGLKRGMSLLVTFAVFAGLITLSMMVFNKPVREVLYSTLGPEDVNQIGLVLSESGIKFDVNEAGTAVLVDFGKTAQARMILAEKGLPKSDKAGYQLFDQMGSLGLTSFMQQVTRVRALEGELVRTIQQLDGIRTARVHLALKTDGTFKSKEEQPTASVVVRTDGKPNQMVTNSIRQIVAAAIPGMLPKHVTVMTTDGSLLNASGGGETGEPDRLLDLEKKISNDTQSRIEVTLSPIAGANNIRVSVSAKLNVDKRQTNETNFDPDSKVERSLRTVKSTDQSSDSSGSPTVSVDQNVPQEVKPAGTGDSMSKKKENKEETVNYEVNSKQTAIESDGYRVERMSLAVVVNRQTLLKIQGATPDDTKLAVQLSEIEAIAKSASGYDEKRGDQIHVSAVDFVAEDATLEPLAGPGFAEVVKGNLGTLINAFALIVATMLVLVMGLRPALKLIGNMNSAVPVGEVDRRIQSLTGATQHASLSAPSASDFATSLSGETASSTGVSVVLGPREKLNKLIGSDVDRAARMVKQWLNETPGEIA
jgi:flagellar M-ring protein FliF